MPCRIGTPHAFSTCMYIHISIYIFPYTTIVVRLGLFKGFASSRLRQAPRRHNLIDLIVHKVSCGFVTKEQLKEWWCPRTYTFGYITERPLGRLTGSATNVIFTMNECDCHHCYHSYKQLHTIRKTYNMYDSHAAKKTHGDKLLCDSIVFLECSMVFV